MKAYPIELSIRDQNRLIITWNIGQQREYSARELRDHCPCATCREKRSAPPPPAGELPVISMADLRPLTILRMKPVGNYAYAISFSDGHDTGIYTLDFLAELGAPISEAHES